MLSINPSFRELPLLTCSLVTLEGVGIFLHARCVTFSWTRWVKDGLLKNKVNVSSSGVSGLGINKVCLSPPAEPAIAKTQRYCLPGCGKSILWAERKEGSTLGRNGRHTQNHPSAGDNRSWDSAAHVTLADRTGLRSDPFVTSSVGSPPNFSCFAVNCSHLHPSQRIIFGLWRRLTFWKAGGKLS